MSFDNMFVELSPEFDSLSDDNRDRFNRYKLAQEKKQYEGEYSTPSYGVGGLLLAILFFGLILISF